MVIAYHIIFTTYGFWLPNDPRGSWSDFVQSWELSRFGGARKINARRSVAALGHNSQQRQSAKTALKYSPVSFNGQEALTIALGFKTAIKRSCFVVYACAILPEHVHLVIARHRYRVELVRDQLKGEASKALRAAGMHPFANDGSCGKPHSPWAEGGWDVYLNCANDIHRAIAYVNNNPQREGKPRQMWSFVSPFTV